MRREKKQERRLARHNRVRARISGSSGKPRISVFRSARRIAVQLIDDEAGKTIAAVYCGARAKGSVAGGQKARAHHAGKLIAEAAKKKDIKQAVFDRGGYAYHGVIKEVAEGAREGGLQF